MPCSAAITSEAVCTGPSVGGTWSAASCALGTQPLCEAAGGVWHATKLWSLKNGADLIIVGLMQGCEPVPRTSTDLGAWLQCTVR